MEQERLSGEVSIFVIVPNEQGGRFGDNGNRMHRGGARRDSKQMGQEASGDADTGRSTAGPVLWT